MNYTYIIIFICVFVTLLFIVNKYLFKALNSNVSDIDRAKKLMEDGKNDIALSKLKNVLMKDKVNNRAKVHSMIGDCYYNLEEYSFAIVEYRHAIDDGYKEPETILSLARSLAKIDRNEQALAQYLTLIKMDDYKLAVSIEIGIIYYNNRQYKNAIKYFNDCLNIQSNNLEALRYKAFCLVYLGDYNDAIAIMNSMIRKTPDNYLLNYNLAMAYMSKGNYKSAIRYYNISSNDKEYTVKSMYDMSICYIKLDDIESAISTLENAINYESYDKDLNLAMLYALSECYDKIGNINKAIEILESIIIIDSNYKDVNDKLNKYKENKYSDNIKKFFNMEENEFVDYALKITVCLGIIPYSVSITDKKYIIVFAKEGKSVSSPKKIVYFRTSYSPIFNDEISNLYKYSVSTNISNSILVTCAVISPDAIRYATMSRIDIIGIKRLENLVGQASLASLPVGITKTEEKLDWVL